MVEAWQHFYEWHDPIALSLFGFDIRWYGLMYVLALLSGYLVGRKLVVKDKLPITLDQYDRAFVWVEIGVILGARLGYILFYTETPGWYFSHPWEIFNPYHNGHFVGISGLSYHGAIVGFVLAAWWFCKREKIKLLQLMDLAVVAGAAGYFFGRIGNFFNQELVGRVTDVPWGIIAQGALRHPSALYEAVLEGLITFAVLYSIRLKKRFDGELMVYYGMLYATARIIAEFFRQPDPQLGFILFGWVTMGQLLSLAMFALALILYFRFSRFPLKK
jgi:phosphatidylglycerol:prolipoprotein diacylglycerol transferase